MSSRMDLFNTREMLGVVSSRSSRLLSSLSISNTGSWQLGEKTHTQEQCDVGMTKVRHQLAFLYILASYIFHSSISSVNEDIMDLLSSTYETIHFDLEIGN